MDSLVRRIKDLDQITFQQLCFHVVSERFPSAKVRYPEGTAGDEGVDLFQGDLTEGPTVWQCKAFSVTIIGDTQKRQIKESLQDALKNVQPKLWILCLNLNLDMKASRWFAKLQKSYAVKGITVADPFDAMELTRELMFRRTIRNHFFPNLALDMQELKSLIKATASGTESIEDSQLEMLATENAEEYLDRLRNRDPRFTYEVTFGGDRGPNVFPTQNEPHLVSSKTDGRKTYKAYARDHEVLRLDPVKTSFKFNESGARKFLDLVRTGKEQTWTAEEIHAFKSTVPLLSEMKFAPGEIAMSVQSMPDDTIIPIKLLFSTGERHAVLDYVEFRKVRSGTEEVEITTVGEQTLAISLVLPWNTTSSVTATISANLPGRNIREVAKACAALKLLQEGCTMELTSLKLNGHLCTLAVDPLLLTYTPGFFRFVDDLAAISSKFNANFPMPSALKLPPDKEEVFVILRALALNSPVELDQFTATLIKSPENATVVPSEFRDEIALRMDQQDTVATLFGTRIQVGPIRIQIGRARVIQLSANMKRFTKAQIGTGVAIPLRPLVPVRFQLPESYEQDAV